jgi:hypothetical protein
LGGDKALASINRWSVYAHQSKLWHQAVWLSAILVHLELIFCTNKYYSSQR